MKKLVLMLMMAAMVVLMTGCMQADYHLTINKDLSGELAYKIGISKDILKLSETSGETDPLKQIADPYKKAGYKIKTYKDSKYKGIIVIKKFDDVRKADLTLKTDETKNVEDDTKITYEQTKGFFYDKVKAQVEVDMTANKLANQLAQTSGEDAGAMDGAGEDQLNAAFAMMGDSIKMTFTLTLPEKVSKHNASKVSDGGKTLQWKLKFGKINKLKVEANAPNTTNIALVIGGAVILLGGAYFLIRRRKANTDVSDTDIDAVEAPAADVPVEDVAEEATEAEDESKKE